MFLNNIIVLLWVVCFIAKNGTSNLIERNSTEDVIPDKVVNDKWQDKFYGYDQNKDGLISATELQKLLFRESNGFVTVSQAAKYIALLDRDVKDQISFEQLEKIKPIMDILSKREKSSLVGNDEVDDVRTISATDLRQDLFYNDDQLMFEWPEEVNEIFDLFDKDGKHNIPYNKLKEIKAMVGATLQLNNLYETFLMFDTDKNGVITVDEVTLLEIDNSKSALSGEAEEMIKIFDKNGDGVIEFFEFLETMKTKSDKNIVSVTVEFAKMLGRRFQCESENSELDGF